MTGRHVNTFDGFASPGRHLQAQVHILMARNPPLGFLVQDR